jgi:hypothetical protein
VGKDFENHFKKKNSLSSKEERLKKGVKQGRSPLHKNYREQKRGKAPIINSYGRQRGKTLLLRNMGSLRGASPLF